MINLLFITLSFTTALRLLPVYLLSKRMEGFNSHLFIGLEQDKQLVGLLKSHGVEYLTADMVIKPDFFSRVAQEKNKYKAAWNQAIPTLPPLDVAYKGVPLLDLTKDYLLGTNLAKIETLRLFDDLNEYAKPDAVLVAYDSGTRKKIMVNRADQKGIPTIHLQYTNTTEKFLYPKKKMNSKYFLLWGEYARQAYLGDEDVSPDRVFIVGNPTYDLHRFQRDEAIKTLELPENARTIIFNVVDSGKTVEQLLEGLASCQFQDNDYLIFKLHPNFAKMKREVATRFSSVRQPHSVICDEASPYQVLAAGDYFITACLETFFTEALYYGLKTIIWKNADLFGHSPDFQLFYDACLTVDELREAFLPGALEAFPWKSTTDLVKYIFHANDFNSSQRVLDAVLSIVKGGASG